MQEEKRRARGWLAPAGLVALLLLVKAWIFLSIADVYFLGEELARGSVAKALMDDLPVPWHQTVYWYYEGGGFVSSILARIAFGALGPSLLAHKLVALGYNVAILLAGLRLMSFSFGRVAAVLFGLLFVLAPEGFQKFSLLNLGTHYDALLFLILILHFGLWIALEQDAPGWTFAALGLVAGFGCYFDYQNAPAALLIGVVVAWTRRRRLLGPLGAVALSSFALGILPLGLMWSRVGMEIFDVHGTHLLGAHEAAAEPSEEWSEIAASVTAGESPADLVVLALAYALPLLGAAALALNRKVPRRARATSVVVAAHAVVIGALYLQSGLRMPRFDQTYFALGRFCPFWLAGVVLTAGYLAWLIQRPARPRRNAGLVLAAVLVLAGVNETARVLRAGRPLSAANLELIATTKGYSYVEYLPYLRNHLDGGLEEHLGVALAFDERDPEALYPEVAQALLTDASLSLADIQALARATDPEQGRLLLLGLGPWLIARGGFARAVERVRGSPPGLQPALWEALGRWPSPRHATPRNLAQEIAAARELHLPELFWRGLGHRVYRAFRLDPEGGRAFAAEQGSEAPLLAEGFERAFELNRAGAGR